MAAEGAVATPITTTAPNWRTGFMSDERLTCLIPTHNRPHFLRRLLRFYSQVPAGYRFLVVDSSRTEHAAENRALIEDFRSDVEVEYLHLDLNFMDKCVRGLESIATPLVVFCADDDLLFPGAVRQCADFIENESGYSAAMGRTVQLDPSPRRWQGNGLRVLRGYSIEQDLPLERCRQMADSMFSSFYAVYRTESLLHNFRITATHTDSQVSLETPEMLLSQLSVMSGRLKVLPLMYSIRERHRTNAGAALRSGVRPEPELYYQQFKECLTAQFQIEGEQRGNAESFIDHSFGFLRSPSLSNRRPSRSAAEHALRVASGIKDRAVDLFWTGQARYCRPVQSRDYMGCESEWHAAIQLIREFPQGMPSDQSVE